MPPRRAVARLNVGYFAGDFTLPGSVRARRWGSLATGEPITPERRRIRTLSRGTRQLLGLRTALSRRHLALVVLDEPWEGLDVDGAHWLSRKYGAAKIRHDLRAKGVADELVGRVAVHGELETAHAILARKYRAPADTREERARRARFLQSRGFSGEIIRKALQLSSTDDV